MVAARLRGTAGYYLHARFPAGPAWARLGEAQESIAEGEVREDAGIQNDEGRARHFRLGSSTRSYMPARFNNLTDSPERIEPPLALLLLVKEVPDRPLDQFAGAPVPATREFMPDLLSQTGPRVTSMAVSSFSIYAFPAGEAQAGRPGVPRERMTFQRLLRQ